MATSCTRQAKWMGDQYVVTDTGNDEEWYSADGDYWTDQDGNAVKSFEFAVSRIVLCSGPRDGETVS